MKGIDVTCNLENGGKLHDLMEDYCTFLWWLSARHTHRNTNKNILFQGCFSLLYVLMEFILL